MWGRNSELKRKDKRAKSELFSVEITVLEFSKVFFCHAATNCLFQMMWKAMIFICILVRNRLLEHNTIKFFFCFATKRNSIFHIYIIAFSLRSQNHLQIVRRIWPLSISTIQQKAAVPFYQQGNRGTKRLCCWVMVAGGGGRISSGSKSPDSQSHEQNRTASLIFHVFSPDQLYPPALSAAKNMPTPVQAQLAMDTLTPQNTPADPHTPSRIVQAHTCLPLCTTTCWELRYGKWVHNTATTSSTATRGGNDHLWPLRPRTKEVLHHCKDHATKGRPSHMDGRSLQWLLLTVQRGKKEWSALLSPAL